MIFDWAQLDGFPGDELKLMGIPGELVRQASNCDQDAVIEICALLIEQINDGRQTIQGARGEAAVGRFAIQMLEQHSIRGIAPAQELSKIFRVLLKLDRPHAGFSKNRFARIVATFLIAETPEISAKKVGKLCCVSTATVSGWLTTDDFKRDVESISQFLGLKQNLDRWVGPDRDTPIE